MEITAEMLTQRIRLMQAREREFLAHANACAGAVEECMRLLKILEQDEPAEQDEPVREEKPNG